jgi:hypothetical protein
MRLLRSLATFAALAVALLFSAEDADARFEGGLHLGKHSARLFIARPVVRSASTMLVALDRSMTGQPAYPGGSLGDLFSRPGLVGGFAAGFLGAGLLGLLFGHGLFGGLGGVTSFLGLMLQITLVVMLGRLIWTWWLGRNAPAFTGLSPRQQAEAYLRSRNELLPGVYPATREDDASTGTETARLSAHAAETSTRSDCEK